MAFNIKRLSALTGLIILPIALFAASPNSLKGKITDDKGEAVAGALVSIPDLKTGVPSDATGDYILSGLPKGKYLVEVRLLGYATITKHVNINGESLQNFQLSQSIIEKNEIIITGSSLATEERKSAFPIQSVRMEELKQNAYTNVIDAIAKQPGISQLSTGPAISKPVIRGLGYNRIITLNDGVRQEGQQWGDEHGIEIDDYNVTRVEILKGPASLAYGSDALAGVINIISDEPLPPGRIDGNLAANYQTNNGMMALHAQTGGNINGFSWNVYGTGKQAHDYKNAYDGYVYNSRFNNVNYGATIGINKKWGYSHLSFTSFNQNLGIVEGGRDSATGKFLKVENVDGNETESIATDEDSKSYSRQMPAQRIEHQKLVWNNSIYTGNGGRFGITLGYQQNTRKEFEDVLAPNTPGLFFLLKTYNYDLKYFFPEFKGWQVTTGINGMWQHNENKGVEFLIPDYKLFDGGLYGIAKKEIGKWSVSGGLRANYRTISGDALYLDAADEKVNTLEPGGYTRFAPFTRNFSNGAGSIGASYAVNRSMTLKMNVASGFRSPNIAELSANGVHEGTIRYEYGDAELTPEQSVQADLGLIWNSDHILIDGAVFYNHINNFIYIQKLASVNGGDSIPAEHNDEGFAAFRFTQTSANLYGGELYIDFHPHPLDWLHLENTFSYVRGNTTNSTDSTKYLPYMPPARWLIELKAQKSNLSKRLKNTYAKFGADVNFSQDNVFSAFGTETATPGYTLFNAGIGADFVNKKQRTIFSLTLSAQNLTDVAYQNHLSRLKYADVNNVTGRGGVFNTGRNISLQLSVPLVFKGS